MQILKSLRTFDALKCEIIGTSLDALFFLDYSCLSNGAHPGVYISFKNAHSETLYHLKGAVSLWNSMGMDFSVSLGDLIDGQNSGNFGQGYQ